MHHLAYSVDNVQQMIEKAKGLGLVTLSDKAKDGVHGTKIVFMHPKSTFGVLTELVEHCWPTDFVPIYYIFTKTQILVLNLYIKGAILSNYTL